MSTIKEVFKTDFVFLAVVHVQDAPQALENALIAHHEGADGIFLINHAISHTDLIASYCTVRERCPDLWIGINCLDLGRDAIHIVPLDVQGLWADDGEIDETAASLEEAEAFRAARLDRRWHGLYFGGVAFKYRTQPADAGKAAVQSARFVDVITTSGPKTGAPPSVEKVSRMKQALGRHPLAIASGITPENVREYMPFADCVLVATGISRSERWLDPGRVHALAMALGK